MTSLTPIQREARVTPEQRWTSLPAAERVRLVRDAAARGLTENEINAETGAANGAVRVICRRHSIVLTKTRERRLEMLEPEEGTGVDVLRRRIITRAAAGARRTRIEQFGASA